MESRFLARRTLLQKQNRLATTPLSVLDLAFVREGGSFQETFQNTLDLARQAERLGYKRFWLAEHHSINGVACSATSVLIAHVANGTSKIRVGSGGVMLPNHAPLVIAEQFGTLEALYPGRIDLGLGRAPGGDFTVTRALRRTLRGEDDDFADLLHELRGFLAEPVEGQAVKALPGSGAKTPIWLLGSSGYSANLAGVLGLPFAFASHFQPDNLMQALEIYRQSFEPSEVLDKPYAMAAVPVIAADTKEKAELLASTAKQSFLNLIRNHPAPLAPPVEKLDWNPLEEAAVAAKLRAAIFGDPETVRTKLEEFLEQTQVQELMVVTNTYDHADRLRSYELVAQL